MSEAFSSQSKRCCSDIFCPAAFLSFYKGFDLHTKIQNIKQKTYDGTSFIQQLLSPFLF